MSATDLDLGSTIGYVVADAAGRVLGRVECPMYGRSREVPDAIAVRSSLRLRRRLVPAESIEQIDGGTRRIGLRVERDAIRSFL